MWHQLNSRIAFLAGLPTGCMGEDSWVASWVGNAHMSIRKYTGLPTIGRRYYFLVCVGQRKLHFEGVLRLLPIMAASMCALALMALITLIELPDSFAFAIKNFILIQKSLLRSFNKLIVRFKLCLII